VARRRYFVAARLLDELEDSGPGRSVDLPPAVPLEEVDVRRRDVPGDDLHVVNH
jgi:hypothetical protein